VPPRRIKHGTKSTYVEKFLFQWAPEECNQQEAQQQQNQGFEITSIVSLDKRIATPALQAATALKRPKGRSREADRISPTTKCLVQYAPSPQGPTHIDTIKGGAASLATFLASITLAAPTALPTQSRITAAVETQALPHTHGGPRPLLPAPPTCYKAKPPTPNFPYEAFPTCAK